MSNFQVFLPIAKIDQERRLVSGYASTQARDSDGEIIELAAVKKALPDYLEYGNIREMHKLNAVGVAAETNMDQKGLYLTAYIADDAVWKKCLPNKLPDGTVLPPVYKGFSIGGRKLNKKGDRITELELNEISVVDRPANPECKIDIAKAEGEELPQAGGYLVKAKAVLTPEQKALRKVAKALAKAGPPAARDGFSLPASPRANVEKPKVKEVKEPVVAERPSDTEKAGDETACERHGKVGCKKCAIVKRMSEPCAKHNAVGCAKCAFKKRDKKPYGNVKYADPGHQADGKARYPIDTEEHIRAAWNYINKPKNAAKYGEHAAGVKSKIVGAWKKKIHPDGPPSASASTEKAASGAASFPAFLELKKGMGTGGSLSYVFDSLRNAQRSLMLEGHREVGDKKDHKLAARLGALAKDLSSIISDKALHEGGEATDLSDADDHYVNHALKRQNTMSDDSEDFINRAAAGGDPLGLAILDMVKRAAAPTRMQRMSKAEENIKESRKAAKAARSAIEECHKMHKAAFLAKVEKAKKSKDDKDDDEFDHAGAMEKLQKAYAELDKARTFGKAAMGQLQKASGRKGQQGQEVSDGQGAFYEVPAGIKDLSPNDMARASPGGPGMGSEPTMYPVDGGVFPGKAAGGGGEENSLRKYMRKDGSIPAEVVELIMQKAASEGELAALRQLPRSAAGGARPFAFDTTRVMGGAGGRGGAGDLNKALFNGVDVSAIGSGDERAHTAATAKAIGNFLTSGSFAKSVLDPEFHGAAGN